MSRSSPVVDTQTAATATTQSAAIPSPLGGGAPKMGVYIDVTAVGVTPTLDVTLEYSLDGTNFLPEESAADSFTQITAIGRAFKVFDVKAAVYRLVYTIGGTTPSFTFTVRHVALG